MKSANEIKERFDRLLEGFNNLEGLFKTCQIALRNFRTSILNEYHYFARALVDCCKSEVDAVREEAIARAEVALSCAYNDIVDYLVDNVRYFVQNARKEFWDARINDILNTYGYEDVCKATKEAEKLIAQSRKERETRFQKYVEFTSTDNFKKLVDFVQSLPAIEYACQLDNLSRNENNSKNLSLLRRALGNTTGDTSLPRFMLFLQPKFFCERTRSGNAFHLVGAEALIRLRIPGNGIDFLKPDDFLPLARASDISRDIDNWVRDSAIMTACDLKKNYRLPDGFDLSINVDPEQIASDDFVNCFSKHSRQNNVDGNVSIELIEDWSRGSNISNIDNISRNVNDRLGDLPEKTKVFIDDFGTGTTKFEYLAHIEHLAGIKIDRSFVEKLGTNKQAKYASLIQGIVRLANTCNLNVIAEGVEHDVQINALLDLGVNQFQGFHKELGVPVSVDTFKTKHLENYRL